MCYEEEESGTKLDALLWPSMAFEVILIKIRYLCIHNISFHINFYQDRFINESVGRVGLTLKLNEFLWPTMTFEVILL